MALMPLNCWNRNSSMPTMAARLDSTSAQEGAEPLLELSSCLAAGMCRKMQRRVGWGMQSPRQLRLGVQEVRFIIMAWHGRHQPPAARQSGRSHKSALVSQCILCMQAAALH